MSEWFNMHDPKNQPPKDGTKIIVATRHTNGQPGRVMYDWFFEAGEWGDEDEVESDLLYEGEFVSHWRPKLTAPQD